jgi:hypothetical protein
MQILKHVLHAVLFRIKTLRTMCFRSFNDVINCLVN